MGIYLQSNPIGYAGIVVSHQMPNDRYNERLPDISYRHNTYKQLREKAHFYLDNGARMVWLVYPEKQLVEVYRSDSDIEILMSDEMFSGYDVLPNFELPVQDIFA